MSTPKKESAYLTKTTFPRELRSITPLISYGDNQRIEKPQKSITEYILENFEDPMLRILCAASFVSLVIGVSLHGLKEGWLEGFAIFIAVIIIVTVTSFNNYTKDQQFRKLSAQAEDRKIDTVRDGKIKNISIYSLLVGDIVNLTTGDILPADGLLFQASNITTDESSITGETHLVKKAVPEQYLPIEKANCFLFSGSKIMEGSG